MPAAVRAGERAGAGTGARLASGAVRLYGRGMGFFELLVLLFVVLLFFGAGKLPALGEGLGKVFRGFRDAARAKTPEEPPGREPEKRELPAAPPGPEEPKG